MAAVSGFALGTIGLGWLNSAICSGGMLSSPTTTIAAASAKYAATSLRLGMCGGFCGIDVLDHSTTIRPVASCCGSRWSESAQSPAKITCFSSTGRIGLGGIGSRTR